MDYKVLVLDIDGTLVNSKKEVTENTKKAIKKLQEKGIKIVLASGRPVCGIERVAKEIELDKYDSYLVSYNGGKVINYKTKEVIYEKTMSEKYIPALYKFADDNNVAIITYDEPLAITNDANDEYVLLETGINGLECKQVDDFVAEIKEPVIKCLIVGEGDKMAQLEIQAREMFGKELNVFRSEPHFLEITPQHIDKAYSLGKLLESLGLTREEMVACGDGFNDISMIEYAGLGVAMENAQQKVKDVADYITVSNDEDGVAKVIEKFFNNNLN